MRAEVCESSSAAAVRAADLLARQIGNAIDQRGAAAIALSGGHTPAGMFRKLAAASVEWPLVHIFQVDERLVPADDDRRNMKAIRTTFLRSGIPADQLHAMPASGTGRASRVEEYAGELRAVAGTPPILDVVHLGLGEDGHTASLFPGDAAVDAEGDVALSEDHAGVRRMTLTLNAINRARMRIWLVTGAAKRSVVRRLLEPGSCLIAHRVRTEDSVLIVDGDAAIPPR